MSVEGAGTGEHHMPALPSKGKSRDLSVALLGAEEVDGRELQGCQTCILTKALVCVSFGMAVGPQVVAPACGWRKCEKGRQEQLICANGWGDTHLVAPPPRFCGSCAASTARGAGRGDRLGPSPRPARAGGRTRSRTRRVKATGVRLELGVGCRRANRGWGGGSRAGGSRCDGALGGAAPSIALLSLI